MDANREMELAELKDSIKKERLVGTRFLQTKTKEKVQDEIISLRRLEEKEKQGESQPKKSWTSSLETIRRVPCIPI